MRYQIIDMKLRKIVLRGNRKRYIDQVLKRYEKKMPGRYMRRNVSDKEFVGVKSR